MTDSQDPNFRALRLEECKMDKSIIDQFIALKEAGNNMRDVESLAWLLYQQGQHDAFELILDRPYEYFELLNNDFVDEVPDDLKICIDRIEEDNPKAVTSPDEIIAIALNNGNTELADFIRKNKVAFTRYIQRERPSGFQHSYYVIRKDTNPRDLEAAKAAADEFGLYATCHEAMEKLYEVTGGDFSVYCVRGFRN